MAESFKQMKDAVRFVFITRIYANNLNRPFVVNYNALSQTIEVLDTKDKIIRLGNSLQGELTKLISAIDKLQ